MPNYILFDDHSWENLLPLTFTRPVGELRWGILRIREKWEAELKSSFSYITQDYLSQKYPLLQTGENLLVNSALLPNNELIAEFEDLKSNEWLYSGDRLLAAKILSPDPLAFKPFANKKTGIPKQVKCGFDLLDWPWQLFRDNGREIRNDFERLTKNRRSAQLSSTCNLISPENIFSEEGLKAEYVTINASTGPVYLGKNAEIMEGSLIRGPFALGEGSVVKLGAKIYGPTTIGPFCKAGGEINNSILMTWSNKGHDGFLGNSILGEWCNIGADSNNSNLKNNYTNVKIWNYQKEKFIDTGLQFCGLIMGDHSKCGINTMFNTGTIVGVSANIFGSGFPRNFIPSFSWGGVNGFTTYSVPKAFETAKLVMERRDVPFDEVEKQILKEVFRRTGKFRH